MFANWNLLLPPDKDQAPPRAPVVKKARLTSVTYPRCLSLSSTVAPTSPPSPPELEALSRLFGTVRKSSDITVEHLQLLNVSYSYDLPLSSLIPAKYLPDEKDEKSPFNQMKKEVCLENQDAYDVIARRRRDLKIGNFYKFFQTAEMVELLLSSEAESSASAAAAAASSSSSTMTTPMSPPGKDITDGHATGSSGGAVNAAARSSARYREELLRHFVDPIAWGFEMRI
ncbi:hypothetical protein ABW20_dc0105981 [Dactylellina cionopaga]|nr:hypothetical protein ABW20_dc0105981 [Dactylellina cionopaga]